MVKKQQCDIGDIFNFAPGRRFKKNMASRVLANKRKPEERGRGVKSRFVKRWPLVSPSGMVETPCLEAKLNFA